MELLKYGLIAAPFLFFVVWGVAIAIGIERRYRSAVAKAEAAEKEGQG